MVIPEAKTAASAILARYKGEDPSMEGEIPAAEEGFEETGLDAAADDMMAAFHAKDSQGLKTALKSFVELCGAMPQGESEIPFAD